jgi:drug/metabolite transporter (DMT)-like permease
MIISISFSLIGTLLFFWSDLLADDGLTINFEYLKLIGFAVLGMLTWILYSFQAKKLQNIFNDTHITVITQVCSLFSCFLIWFFSKGLNEIRLPSLSLSVVLLGLSSPIAYFAYSYCIRRLPGFAMTSQFLEPVVGLFIGVLYFAETITLLKYLGVAIILVSMWGLIRAENRTA